MLVGSDTMENIFTIIGSDKKMIDDTILEIENQIIGSFDKVLFDLEEHSIILLLEELKTIPFLNDYKIVIVKHFETISNSKKIDPNLLESLYKILSHPFEETILFAIYETQPSATDKIFSTLKKNSVLKILEKMQIQDVASYIQQSCAKDGYAITKLATEDLCSRCEGNIDKVEMELTKLKTYALDKMKIDENDVALLIPRDLEDNIYELVSAVLEKDRKKIMTIYKDLMILNEEETRIVNALLNKFNEMFDVRSLVDKNFSKDDIAAFYNVKPGRAYYMIKNAKESSLNDIKKNIKALADLDYQIKSGKIDKTIGLELYLLKI